MKSFSLVVTSLLVMIFIAAGCDNGIAIAESDELAGGDAPIKKDVDQKFSADSDKLASDQPVQSDADTDSSGSTDGKDDDGDGIPNSKEGTGDTDGDGIPDFKDTDSDGDGLDDKVEAPNGAAVDTDKDGISDYIDTDADGDGIKDSAEGKGDGDGDGVPNYRDTDSDGDGILDSFEVGADAANPVDTDTDGNPDFIDTDADGDDVPDVFEGNKDFDKDGTPNFRDDDADGDGILDKNEGVLVDLNNDGTPETPRDTDGDKNFDFLDSDSDNDGLSDAKEITLGTDPAKKDTDGDTYDDATEVAAGSDPKVSNPEWWNGKFYVTLPYNDPVQEKELIFSTDIRYADIAIAVDLSGSMNGEHNNLKSGIKDVIINGIKAKIPNAGFGLLKFGTVGNTVYKVERTITTDANAVKTSVDTIAEVGGSAEYHTLALYLGSNGEAYNKTINAGSVTIAAANCPANTFGGMCFRKDSLPIFIMASDEAFFTDAKAITRDQAVAAMNKIGAKFIGLNSGASGTDFDAVASGTKSVDKTGKNFNQKINTDGTGMSNQIVDAVLALAKGIQIDVSTLRVSIANPENVDTTQFIKAVEPLSADPGQGTGFDSKDQTTFYKVTPGTKVTFKVLFQNTVYQNLTTEMKLFTASINVMGANSLLDTREVYILVPGVPDDGGEH